MWTDIVQNVLIILLILWNFHIVAGTNKSLRVLVTRVVRLERKNRG